MTWQPRHQENQLERQCRHQPGPANLLQATIAKIEAWWWNSKHRAMN
jgi:hypothetical protein